MYHIKPDKRSQASALEIVRGLEICLKNKPLKEITVTDLHRITGISRATFYRLFDTPEDVLHYQFAQMAEESLVNHSDNWQENPDKLMEGTIAQGMQNNEFLKAVVANGRFDLLYLYTEQNFRVLDEKAAILPKGMEPIEREYVLSQLSMAMVAILITWSKNGRKESPGEIVQYLKRYAQLLQGLTGGK